MAEYSDMPGLVDNPYPTEFGGATPQMAYAGTPYATFSAAQPWPGSEGGSPPAATATWATQQQSQQQQQPAYQQWPSASPWQAQSGYVSTPAVYPAPMNPGMAGGGDEWAARQEEPAPRWARMHDDMESSLDSPPPRKYDGDGRPMRRPSVTMSRSMTPFSSKTSSPSSLGSGSNVGVSRSRSLRSLGESNMRPPREWRTDFSMSKSAAIGQALGSLFTKRRSASVSFIDPLRSNKISLHPYLRYASSGPPMHLDLRLNPSTLRFRALERPINEWDLTRFACEPPLAHMRLYNAHFPWFVDVESANPAGVTLHELFSGIYAAMMMPITQADFWNNEMDESVRERIGLAWAKRCPDEEERSKGVRRVDFLMGRVVMEGLMKGKDGLWEIKIRKL